MQLKEKVINCVSNGKDMTSHLIVGLIKKTLNEIPCIKMSEYFPKVFKILEKKLMLKLIYLIMQQKQISKIFHILILQVLH